MGGQDEAHAVATLAEALKNDLDAAKIIPGQDEKALLYRDLLTAAIQEIDFEEVAQGIAEE